MGGRSIGMNSTPDPMETALQWLQRRHAGHWAEADERQLQNWLDASPQHREAWARADTLWAGLQPLAPRAQESLAALARQGRPVRRPMWPWFGGAVVSCVLLAAWGLQHVPGAFDEPRLLHSARGQQLQVDLPDGSRAHLNTTTRLRIRTSLSCRCVELEQGEVVFTVAHGDPRPFRVSAGRATVVDIGTTFWARREVEGTQVAVVEGEVDAWGGNAEAVRLKAGDTWAVDARGHAAAAPRRSVADLTAWQQGRLVFRDAPLTEVLAELARYHAVRFDLDERLAAYRLSGTLDSSDLDGALRLLERGYPAQVQQLADGRMRVGFRAH